MTLTRAHDIITSNKSKEASGVPSHEIVKHHIHKLVQVLPVIRIFASEVVLSLS